MAYPNTEDDGHEHEYGDAKIESADWIIPPDAEGKANGQPKVFKEGTALMSHQCKKCGETVTWKV